MRSRVFCVALAVGVISCGGRVPRGGKESMSQAPVSVQSSHMASSPEPSPRQVAALEHLNGAQRLVLIDIGAAEGESLLWSDPTSGNLVFSPEGAEAAFRSAAGLHFLNVDSGDAKTVHRKIDDLMPSPRSYSQDGRWFAIIDREGVAILPIPWDNTAPETLNAPEGYRPTDLLWSPHSDALFVLAKQKSGEKRKLLRIDPASRRVISEIDADCVSFLGWDAHTGDLLVTRTDESGDEAGRLDDAGRFVLLRRSGDHGAEYYAQYLSNTGRLLFSLGADDASDSTALFLATPGQAGETTWLEAHRHISSIRFTRGGEWAVFSDASRKELIDAPGGDLYLVETGSEAAKPIRVATRGLSYSAPVPRP
jgi:hypothetical protein